MASLSVVWFGALEGPSGYADETRGFLRALERAGMEPAARAIMRDRDAELGPADRAMLAAQTARPARGCAVAVHHYAPAWARDSPALAGAANVGRTMFETDSVSCDWLPQLLSRDEIWVPSHAGAAAFEHGGVPASRLRVVPGTLDFDLFQPGLEPLALDVPDGAQVFLSNFAFSERKAWRQLLAAWARAFAPTDPVVLVLKTNGGDSEKAIRARVDEAVQDAARAAGRPGCAPVQVVTDNLSTTDLARLYASADAYVLPSRGEGWGRPYMEAMAMGLPTVGSRFLGNLEFMTDATSWLVDGELVPVPDDHDIFIDDVSGHRWFDPDVDQLAAILTEIASDPDAARRKAAGARPDLIERFGPEATARRLREAIDAAAERYASLAGSGRAAVLRGPFGRNASLAIVNDRLLEGLEDGGRRVGARQPGAPADRAPVPTVTHHWPPDLTPGSAGPTVAMLAWEFGSPPAEWAAGIPGQVDRVVVYSEYVRDCFVEAGTPPGSIEVVPCGVDLDAFTPDGAARDLGVDASCVFLFVGGTIWRKGVDLLLEAWERAFGPEDDVALVIKDFGVDSHYRGQTSRDRIRETAAREDVATVVHFEDHLAPDELPALYRAADVLVAPYRGEGFCLPILEAMACGVPAVHTAIGPSAEFCGDDAGWAVAADRVYVAGEGLPPIHEVAYVHEVRIDALVEALRTAAASSQERERRGAVGTRRARTYSWAASAARLEQVLADLEREGLEPVRDVVAERPESRGTLVAYAPDWDAEDRWSAVLERWVEDVPADADVTLALCVAEDRAGDVAERVMALLDGLGRADLPDLALHSRPDDDPLPLVLGADAVLLDDAQAAAPPPRLHRRARRLLTTEILRDAFKAPDPAPTTRA